MTGNLGVIATTESMDSAALSGFAIKLEQFGYESLWLPELFGREPIATAAYLLAKTTQLKVATGIANIYIRDACAMAQTRQTLQELSSGRFILGLGVSNPGLNQARGHVWQMPLPKMKSYLAEMSEAEIDSPRPEKPAPLYIAAHGPKLQSLGAKHTDGIITYLMPPTHTRTSRKHVGDKTNLTVVSPFLLESDPVLARRKARKALQYYMTLDYYHREWSQLGFSDADFSDGGSDRLIDTLVGWGDKDALVERLNSYYSAGADRVIAMPFDTLSADGKDSLSALSPSNAGSN